MKVIYFLFFILDDRKMSSDVIAIGSLGVCMLIHFILLLFYRWNAQARVLYEGEVQDGNNWLHLGSGAGRRVEA